MKKRVFCIVLAALLVCSSAVLNSQSAMALVIQSQVGEELEENHKAVEELRARRKVGRKIQELGYSPAEVESRLNQFTGEEICCFADNLSFIREGGAGEESIGGGEILIVILLVLIVAGIVAS